jgi:hypothetical protein
LRPCSPGSRERATDPQLPLAVDEDHVIELVDRLEAEDERRVAVLLEDDGREQRRLETVRARRAGRRRGKLRSVARPPGSWL